VYPFLQPLNIVFEQRPLSEKLTICDSGRFFKNHDTYPFRTKSALKPWNYPVKAAVKTNYVFNIPVFHQFYGGTISKAQFFLCVFYECNPAFFKDFTIYEKKIDELFLMILSISLVAQE